MLYKNICFLFSLSRTQCVRRMREWRRQETWRRCQRAAQELEGLLFDLHLEAQTELGGLQEADRAGGGEDEDKGGDEAVADWDWPHTQGSLVRQQVIRGSLSLQCRPALRFQHRSQPIIIMILFFSSTPLTKEASILQTMIFLLFLGWRKRLHYCCGKSPTPEQKKYHDLSEEEDRFWSTYN